MKFVSLFSGIGGLDLGLERAGHECILQVELDDYCQRVLAKHWPDAARIADVRDVTAADCEGTDMIVGGFPCQPVSVAGKRLGINDPRWLWPPFAQLLRVVRPRFVLVENTPGLLSVNDGAAMSEVCGDLAALGYDTEWHRISAASMGAPHLRHRIFIVAHAAIARERQLPVRPRGSLEATSDALGGSEAVPDAAEQRPPGSGHPVESIDPTSAGDGEAAQPVDGSLVGQWAVEPDVGRVAHGVPKRVDRLRALGNAVVPQVAELVGRRLMELDS